MAALDFIQLKLLKLLTVASLFNTLPVRHGWLAQWLALLHHSEKVLSLTPPAGRSVSVWSLHIVHVFVQVESGYYGFLL